MFGGTTPSNPFGGAPQTPSAFGTTPAPTTGTSSFGFGGFGSTPSAPTSAFGATQPTTSAFGSTPAAPFGATTGFAGQQSGTAIAKYVESAVNENNQMVKFLTITAMDQYKNKSNEELRWEDYQRIKQGGGALIILYYLNLFVVYSLSNGKLQSFSNFLVFFFTPSLRLFQY
jgi:nuclear pore complex protein Nup98-Nup96